jgi:hypothetical protein
MYTPWHVNLGKKKGKNHVFYIHLKAEQCLGGIWGVLDERDDSF